MASQEIEELIAYANRPPSFPTDERLDAVAGAAIRYAETAHDERSTDRADDPPPDRMADWLRSYIMACAWRRARERIKTLESACLEARATFQEYVRLHRAKNPPDEEKAQRNFQLAEMLGTALTTFPDQASGETT